MKLNPRVIITLTFFLTIYTCLNYYIGWHLSEWFDEIGLHYKPAVFWVLFGIIVYGYIGGRVPLPGMLKPVGRFLKVVGSYYVFVFEMSFLFLLIADLTGLIVYLSGGNMEQFIIYAGSVIILMLAVLLVIGSRNAWSTVIRKHVIGIEKKLGGSSIQSANSNDSLEQKWVVAVVSDIHLGNMVGNKHLRRLVRNVNAMKPDLILLPGDIIDDSIEPFLRNQMSRNLGLLSAKHGIYAVLGNHEYYGGHVEQYIDEMSRIGIQVLRDETVEVAGSLYVAGRKDKTAESLGPDGRLKVSELLSPLDHSKPIILLDHQPTGFGLAAEAGADILLSGHTHRGQFFPNHLFTKRIFELDWGYMRKAAMHVIVSSGFGSWGPPIRLGSRSEVIQIEVKFQA
jgi:predicted MPP superfamily phosphohydrolase